MGLDIITVVDGVLPPSRTERGPKFEGGQDNVKICLKKFIGEIIIFFLITMLKGILL